MVELSPAVLAATVAAAGGLTSGMESRGPLPFEGNEISPLPDGFSCIARPGCRLLATDADDRKGNLTNFTDDLPWSFHTHRNALCQCQDPSVLPQVLKSRSRQGAVHRLASGPCSEVD